MPTQIPLGLRLFGNDFVDIQHGLFLQHDIVDLDHIFLADAHRPPDGLLHERARPPGAGKDDAVEVLEIEAHATRLELNEENMAVLLARQGHVRGVDDALALLKGERPAVHGNGWDVGDLGEHIL